MHYTVCNLVDRLCMKMDGKSGLWEQECQTDIWYETLLCFTLPSTCPPDINCGPTFPGTVGRRNPRNRRAIHKIPANPMTTSYTCLRVWSWKFFGVLACIFYFFSIRELSLEMKEMSVAHVDVKYDDACSICFFFSVLYIYIVIYIHSSLWEWLYLAS